MVILPFQQPALKWVNGAAIDARTNGFGNAGNITIINAERILLGNGNVATLPTGIGSGSLENSTGDGGNINIQTTRLEILPASGIEAGSQGNGDGGNITVAAETIIIDSKGTMLPTGIATQSGSESGGNVGNITIRRHV